MEQKKKRNKGNNYTSGVRGSLVELMLSSGAITYRGFWTLAELDARYLRRVVNDMKKNGVVEVKTMRHLKYATIKDYQKLELLTSVYRRNGSWKECKLPAALVENWKESKKEAGEDIGLYKELKRADRNRYRVETNTAAIRKYKEAETLQVMWHAGVKSTPVQKPSLVDLTPAAYSMTGKNSYYYTMEDIRKNSNYRVETDEDILDEQIMNSRAIGSLFSEGGLYVVYHFGRDLQMWNKFQENIYKTATKRVAREKMGMFGNKNDNPEDGAIILGYKDVILTKLITPQAKIDISHQNKIIDSAYPSIFYIPVDRNGYYQLKILQRKDWLDEMKNYFIPKSYESDSTKIGRGAHAKGIENGVNKVVYLFTTNNVKELLYFIDRAIASPNTTYQIVAWRYMAATFELDVELPNNVEIKYVDIEDYAQELGIN